jgi:hypothetical protein
MRNTARSPRTVVSLEQLRLRRESLDQRLDDGYRRIGEAELAGQDVAAWEEFWLGLLREYESICEELDRAA